MRTKWTSDQVHAFNKFGSTLYRFNLGQMGCAPSFIYLPDEIKRAYKTSIDMLTISGSERHVQEFQVYSTHWGRTKMLTHSDDDMKRFALWSVFANLGIFKNYKVDHLHNAVLSATGRLIDYEPVGVEISYPEDEV